MNDLYLRAFIEKDYLLINQWRNDMSIQKLVGGSFRYVSLEMEKNWVKEKMLNNLHDVYLAICIKDDITKEEILIGYLSINNIDHLHQTADGGGIVIGDKRFRDGETMINAFLLQLNHVFCNLNINRFTGMCLEKHTDSRLMILSMGFTYEGMKRESIFKNGTFHNQLLFSILRKEFFELYESKGYSLSEVSKRILQLKRQKNKF